MENRKSQFARWIFIHQKVASKTYPNCQTLAKEYEVSSKTIARDMEYLKNELEFPLEYHPVKHGYYYTEPHFSFPLVRMKESEWLSFFILEKLLEPYKNTPFYEKTRSGLEKIRGFLDRPVVVKESFLSPAYSFTQPRQAVIAPLVFDAVTKALDRKKILKMEYQKPHQPKEFRIVEPWHLFFSDGQAYLIAHCRKRGEKRTFALSRILWIEVGEEGFSLPENFNPEEARHAMKAVPLEQGIEVAVLFHAYEAPFIKERQWFEGQTLTEDPSGSVILKFKTRSLFEIKKWVLSFGWTARVLYPEELAHDTALEAEKIVKNYQNPQF